MEPPAPTARPNPPRGSGLDRALRVFGDVRPGEGALVLLMSLSVHLLLIAYYILKTVREPLILAGGGAELKSYAAAVQALLLIGYVPLYGRVASRFPRHTLINVVTLFFFLCIEALVAAGTSGLPYVGFVFFVWVGIFSLTLIAQFWSYANDIYSREAGARLFPLIGVGLTAGAPLGAAIAGWLFRAGTSPYAMMQLAAVLLLLHLGLYHMVGRRLTRTPESRHVTPPPLEAGNGFAMILRSRYLLLMAVFFLVLNIVNTTGEYVLSRIVLAEAADRALRIPGFDEQAFIGGVYGTFFFFVNIATILIQALIVSRIVKYAGIAGIVLALPLVALGTYSMVAAGAGFAVVMLFKGAENSTDYSVMNTGRQMLWLPTTREHKYKAKQAIDTFFVRAGDVLSAGVVLVGTQWLALDLGGFGRANLVFVMVWLVLAVVLARTSRRKLAGGGGEDQAEKPA
jgi:AAA family ATP:ADP antiporter